MEGHASTSRAGPSSGSSNVPRNAPNEQTKTAEQIVAEFKNNQKARFAYFDTKYEVIDAAKFIEIYVNKYLRTRDIDMEESERLELRDETGDVLVAYYDTVEAFEDIYCFKKLSKFLRSDTTEDEETPKRHYYTSRVAEVKAIVNAFYFAGVKEYKATLHQWERDNFKPNLGELFHLQWCTVRVSARTIENRVTLMRDFNKEADREFLIRMSARNARTRRYGTRNNPVPMMPQVQAIVAPVAIREPQVGPIANAEVQVENADEQVVPDDGTLLNELNECNGGVGLSEKDLNCAYKFHVPLCSYEGWIAGICALYPAINAALDVFMANHQGEFFQQQDEMRDAQPEPNLQDNEVATISEDEARME